MSGDRRTPPDLAQRMLAALLGPGEWAEAVLGDLHEEYGELSARSASRARLWYCLEVLRIGARARVRRVIPVVTRALTRPPYRVETP